MAASSSRVWIVCIQEQGSIIAHVPQLWIYDVNKLPDKYKEVYQKHNGGSISLVEKEIIGNNNPSQKEYDTYYDTLEDAYFEWKENTPVERILLYSP